MEVCRKFAVSNDYAIKAAFRDITSGNSVKRHGMSELQAFLRANGPHHIIIKDATRLARNLSVYSDLEAELAALGGSIISATDVRRNLLEEIYIHALS